MIRIIFDNGNIMNCQNIDKIYIEEYEMDKTTIVGSIKELLGRGDQDERLHDMGSGEIGE